ncbi:MAG TPA: YceI family protein [Vicinamibacterales bacterium]|jgi:polyisoprenoid-binding protein YceI|nr:YceI family protein [Vicinamibacterales bacterium]
MSTYIIDKAHSEVAFTVRHLVTKVRGRFSEFAGTIQFDAAQPERSSVDFVVQTASVDTNAADRDTHLRSEDFFHIEKFPTITFVSTQVASRGAGQFDVTGPLTIRGVVKQVTLPVAYLGTEKDPWGNEKAGFETEITLNRKEFGLMWNAALETGGFLVGDDVKIALTIQATAQK